MSAKKEYPDIVAGRWHVRDSRGSIAVFEIRKSRTGKKYEKRISPYYTNADEAYIYLSSLPLAQQDRKRLCAASERFRTLTKALRTREAPAKRQRKILRVIADRKCEEYMSASMIMILLDYSDPNKVRPRITELLQAGLIERKGTMKDAISGKKVWTYGLTEEGRMKI